jgi:hypothetical protein
MEPCARLTRTTLTSAFMSRPAAFDERNGDNRDACVPSEDAPERIVVCSQFPPRVRITLGLDLLVTQLAVGFTLRVA